MLVLSIAHAYDRALAISLTWTAATAMLSTLLALRLAAPDPRQRHASARADTVPSAMDVANQQPGVARRAA